MKCRYCDKTLKPLRSLTDGEFCCDEHRSAFEWEASKIANPAAVQLDPEPIDSTAFTGREDSGYSAPPNLVQSEFGPVAAEAIPVQPIPDLPDAELPLEPVSFESAEPVPAASEFSSEQALAESEQLEEGAQEHATWYAEELAASSPGPFARAMQGWYWLTGVWKNAPFELKVVTLLLPVLLAVAVTPTRSRASVSPSPSPATASKMRHILSQKWKVMQQNIAHRAAIAFTDDFRSGLDAWNSHSKLTSTWSYDAAGFVEPGPLAIFKPTTDLSDYRFDFLGQIDRRAMGFAFRAKNLDNYYAVKFVIVQPGPLPVVHMVRYAVINGKESSRVEKRLPIMTRADMFYRVKVDVRGSDFTIMVQDQVIDFWSDKRLRTGGVGFFCDRGERARLRWVEVTHQYDTIGKLCAFLAPYGMPESN